MQHSRSHDLTSNPFTQVYALKTQKLGLMCNFNLPITVIGTDESVSEVNNKLSVCLHEILKVTSCPYEDVQTCT